MLLRGPSGGGKSALALRLAEAGWRLVADDRVVIWHSGGALWGKAPASLAGLVELRGQGMGRLPPLPLAQIALVADLRDAEDRQPEPEWEAVEGVRLPRFDVRADLSAPARLVLLLNRSVS